MKIYGFQKTTLLDYPEHVAATIFTGGCNFRCPFCQNGGLVLEPERYGLVQEEDIWRHLEKRKGILDGICITGGEPTLQPDLEDFICRVKGMGYEVKLDTNGYRPKVVRQLLEKGMLDYVAMDVKAAKENYAKAAGLESGVTKEELCIFTLDRIEESVELIKHSGIPYEFRTTAVKGLHRIEEFEQIGEWLAGSRAYYIQSYREDGEILKKDGLESFSFNELQEMVRLAGKYILHVELRGMDNSL